MSAKTSAFGPLPVLGGKGVERQEFDLQLAAAFDAFAHSFGALLVAFDPRQVRAFFAQRPLPSMMMAT